MDLAEEQLENEALQRGGLNRVQKGIANLRQLGRLISAAPDLGALHELATASVFDRPKLRKHWSDIGELKADMIEDIDVAMNRIF